MTGAAFAIGLLVFVAALPVRGQDGPKQSFETSATERVQVPPGSTIRLENSYGYLTVEGWDEPEVEVAVTKSTDRFYKPSGKDEAVKRFDQVRVVTERRSDKEVAVSTALAVRKSLFTSVLPTGEVIVTLPLLRQTKRGITVEYVVHVPRDARLIVHQENGYVWVSDVTGNLDVSSHTGDMIVMLPDPGPYAIDAKTRLGSIAADFNGKTTGHFLVGSNFTYGDAAAARQVRLRMGRGSITIKSGPASGPFWKN